MTEPDRRTIDAQIAGMLEPKPSDAPSYEQERSCTPLNQWRAVHVRAGLLEWLPAYQPSTDLNAAMRAYEEFRKAHGWNLSVLTDLRASQGLWWCDLRRGGLEASGSGTTPAMAICLVLLEAAKR